jgi:hypothetical protein
MNNKKYIKCFSNKDYNKLINKGFCFLYEKDGIFYFENNQELITKFSKDDLMNNIKFSQTINF